MPAILATEVRKLGSQLQQFWLAFLPDPWLPTWCAVCCLLMCSALGCPSRQGWVRSMSQSCAERTSLHTLCSTVTARPRLLL